MPNISGIARVDKKTKLLAQRLQIGEIAIIDHKDMDSTSARMLIECKPIMVINADRSISGRYPNTGPGILLRAGIPLIDSAGKDIMSSIPEGTMVDVSDGVISSNGTIIASGINLTLNDIYRMEEESRSNLSAELEKFAQNTLTYIRQEKFLILDPVDVPEIRTSFKGRHALIVVRGEGYKEDLAVIKSYIIDMKPVMVGVDGGADALLELGFKPDVIVGDMDSITDNALMCGSEIVVHAYGSGDQEAPGLSRVKKLGLEAAVFPVQGTSEDMAMLLAYEKDAELIVAVGTHSNLIDFLDKGRAGMASTFLTRLKIGSKLVDAKGASKLYRRMPGAKEYFWLFASAAAVVLVVAFQSPAVRTWFGFILLKIKSLFHL
ncbi:MAG: putative cytokinetic ring protein SteA [Armatimonadota bacterium]